MKEKGKGQNLLTAISFFFLQPKLEILCYYTQFIQILSGLVPKRENTFSVKSSHQKTLEAVQIRGVFWAEHMLMLTDTKFSHSLTDTKHYWSLYKKMAIMYRIVYFSGLKFAQSQWAIRLKSFFFFLYWIVYAHIPTLEIHILSIKQKALTTRKRKKPIYLLRFCFC